jgi:hypothetical protein
MPSGNKNIASGGPPEWATIVATSAPTPERRAGNSHKALENTDQTSPLLGGADYVHLR